MPSSKQISPDAFSILGLNDALVAIVAALGYEEPTPVQRETIPLMLSGRDLLAQAATGTGKTAAFALPMIQRLVDPDTRKSAAMRRKAGGLVLVPTRELAMQVSEAVHKYTRGTGLNVVPLYGGASMSQQIRALERGAEIVVATPGRALDHIGRKTLQLDALRVLVLDEADEMLDMGFAEDIDSILAVTPAARQTTLFSATLPSRILAISKRHLKDPVRVMIAHEKTAAGKLPRVRQLAYVVSRAQKAAALGRVLDMEDPTSAIVFCRTRVEVDSLVETMNAHGYRAEALHGGMQQRQRDAVMNRVRAAKTDLLIATDVAARGLDIEHLSHVINYDLPAAPESYIHRIGRTGRMGRAGTAISLTEPREHRLLRAIEQLTKQKIEVAGVPSVADLRARRMDLTRAAVRERLVAGDFDDMRVVVESLADEFDVLDIAAAAVKMAHAPQAGDENEQEFPDLAASSRGRAAAFSSVGRPTATGRLASAGPRFRDDQPRHGTEPPRLVRHKGPPQRGTASRRPGDSEVSRPAVRLFIGAGRRAGIRPADLVGAITGEAGVSSSALGAIQITDSFSLVDVPEELAGTIVTAMKAATLRGQKVIIRRDRDS